MTTKELTPVELTFHSFRHSQSSFNLQALILHSVEVTTGVVPSFATDESIVNRYANFLNNKGSVRHAESVLDRQTICDNIAEVETAYQAFDRAVIEKPIGAFIAEFEIKRYMRLLNDRLDKTATARAEQRLRSGQNSFLFYFGRDARNTGFDAFNRMYRQAWNLATDTSSEYADLFDRHKALERVARLFLQAEIASL